jgi:hypothetical protein
MISHKATMVRRGAPLPSTPAISNFGEVSNRGRERAGVRVGAGTIHILVNKPVGQAKTSGAVQVQFSEKNEYWPINH